MKNNVLITTMVVIVAIFVGVTLTVQQTSNPVMRRLIEQQSEILSLLRKMERQGGAGTMMAGSAAPHLNQPQNINGSTALLEKKIDSLIDIFKKLEAGAQRPSGPPPEEFTKVHSIDIAHSPVRGNKEAPITIVEFVDFQCPFCARFHPVLNEVIAAYPDKVNYVVKNFPLQFHQQAKPASKAAFAAGEQGKYWEMADLLLENHRSLSEDKIQELAKGLGLDLEKFNADYQDSDGKLENLIEADMTLGQKVQVRGTPTFYLNGRKTMARDLASFKKEIDAILNKE